MGVANELYRWCSLSSEYLQYAVSLWCVNMDMWLVCRCTWCVGMSVIASPDVVANSNHSKVFPIGTTLTAQTTYFIYAAIPQQWMWGSLPPGYLMGLLKCLVCLLLLLYSVHVYVGRS